jgi:hypothetical protein
MDLRETRAMWQSERLLATVLTFARPALVIA